MGMVWVWVQIRRKMLDSAALFPDCCPFYQVGQLEQLVSGSLVEQTCKVLGGKSQ
jgi:hypothetical protein